MLDQVIVVVGVTFLVMISPGPDMVIVLRNTIVGGRMAGLATSSGVLAGNLVHIAYCALGVGWLISQSIVAFATLKYAGAAYLVYLGWASLRAAGTTVDLEAASKQRIPDRSLFIQGMLNNLLNPKGTLFYLGVFTVAIRPETSAGGVLLLIAIMMSISASFWLCFVHALDSSVVRAVFEHGQRTMHRVFGGLLILLGIRVATLDS